METSVAFAFETWIDTDGARYVKLPDDFDYFDVEALAAVRTALDRLS